jgi:hypothetical protein
LGIADKLMVLLPYGGFFITCTMKRCLHRKVDFKTNALNNAHVSQLLHFLAGLLQNDGIIVYLQIKPNSHCNENPIYVFLSWE